MKKLQDGKIFQDAQTIYNSDKSSQKEKQEAWNTMFYKVLKCCDVHIRKWLVLKRIVLDDEDRDGYSLEATIKIMNRYKKEEKKGNQYKIMYLTETCRLATMGELLNERAKFERNIKLL